MNMGHIKFTHNYNSPTISQLRHSLKIDCLILRLAKVNMWHGSTTYWSQLVACGGLTITGAWSDISEWSLLFQ